MKKLAEVLLEGYCQISKEKYLTRVHNVTLIHRRMLVFLKVIRQRFRGIDSTDYSPMMKVGRPLLGPA